MNNFRKHDTHKDMWYIAMSRFICLRKYDKNTEMGCGERKRLNHPGQ